jgi:hypothetical protein
MTHAHSFLPPQIQLHVLHTQIPCKEVQGYVTAPNEMTVYRRIRHRSCPISNRKHVKKLKLPFHEHYSDLLGTLLSAIRGYKINDLKYIM